MTDARRGGLDPGCTSIYNFDVDGVVRLSASANLPRCGLLAAALLHATIAYGGETNPRQACGCPDGRRYSIGASVFGKDSARVLVTGFRPQPPASAHAHEVTQCTDLLVLGQFIHLLNTPDGRPFLKRENLKRGVIHNICDTKIQFVEAKKSYDFFADDGSAVTLTEDDANQASASGNSDSADSSHEEPDEVELDENLTGKDLLQLVPKRFGNSPNDPAGSGFDEEDLKEGAYIVCRKRVKATLAHDGSLRQASAAHASGHAREEELGLRAGTVGRIDKRAGIRSEPLWVVDILPGSAPKPFWQALFPFHRGFGESYDVALPRKVILASSQVLEINHFLDQTGVQSTRFREVSIQSGIRNEHDTTRLPEIYAPPELPLEENIAIAQRSQMFRAIQNATLGLRLVSKNREVAARRGTLVIEERKPDGSDTNIAPNLLRRQCFLRLDMLDNATANLAAQAFVVTGVDIKIFRPKDGLQVSPTYYAIDLELALRPTLRPDQVPLVCRFPSAPIDLALVDMAERILTTRFDVQREKIASWSKD